MLRKININKTWDLRTDFKEIYCDFPKTTTPTTTFDIFKWKSDFFVFQLTYIYIFFSVFVSSDVKVDVHCVAQCFFCFFFHFHKNLF